MPGLIGFIEEFDLPTARNLLKKMAGSMQIDIRYRVDTFVDAGVSLGRLSLGITNSETQPIWNEDKTLCIFMEGELFDYRILKQQLLDEGHVFQVEDNDAEFALHLYEELGEQFAINLNGAYVLAIWDLRTKKLTIVNDRLGLYPLYYTQQNGRLIFASGVRALLADQTLKRQIDLIAISQLLSFEHPLEERTLLSDVQLLEPANILIYQDNRLVKYSYWNLEFKDYVRYKSVEEYVDGFLYYMQQAVTRQAPDGHPAGLLLSGGLDSRMILACLGREPAARLLHSFSFGIPRSDDARLAQELAAVSGVRHQFFELQPDYLHDLAEIGIALTDGQMSCVHMHTLANLEAQTDDIRIIYKGFLGDALMGGHLNRQLWANYDLETFTNILFDDACVGFSIDEQEVLFNEETKGQIKPSSFDSFRSVLAQPQTELLANRHSIFDIQQRQRRFILNGVELVRSRAIVRTPFCDNDLVEFILSVPPGLRLDRQIMIRALSQEFPHLAKIPYEANGLPLIPCFRDLRIRSERLLTTRLEAAGWKWIPSLKRRPYADYAGWLRTDLRYWMENILLKKDSLNQEFFQQTYVRNLVNQHTSGAANHWRKLGLLLTVELWLKQFID